MATVANPHFPRLLSPLTVGRHTLKNRLFMISMHTRLEQMDRAIERRVAFYAERARGGAALLISAGYSPNAAGRMEDDAQTLDSAEQLPEHLPVTAAVHAYGAKMLLQILHAGRYAKHDSLVAPSAIPARINRRTPRAMHEADIEQTILDYVTTSQLARAAGYDGVEIMGSEGYLLNQFCAERTNQRSDAWGGSLENRCRLSIDVVRRVRASLGPEFLIAFRISALDLVEGGMNGEEIDYLALGVEAAGTDLLSTGIGWHESTIPTIAYQVPRGAWRFASARLKRTVSIPVVASNRINSPRLAEEILVQGEADAVGLARPLLADPQFLIKAASGRADEINTCIACNQACLDYIFTERAATCLVNPFAARELEFGGAASSVRRIAVVGAGPAGLSCAITAARRGHHVVLFEAEAEIGGQLNLAKRIPGKAEFHELLRYFRVQLALTGVDVRLGVRVTPSTLDSMQFSRIVIASGSVPRKLDIADVAPDAIATYIDVIRGARTAGRRVAIIGAGGIAHDVAELLSTDPELLDHRQTRQQFFDEWGVDSSLSSRGGLGQPNDPERPREISMFQRSAARPGKRLGVSTGWILRKRLSVQRVRLISGCEYSRIDRSGLHYRVDGRSHLARVDTVVVCAGQDPDSSLAAALRERDKVVDLIGGAHVAAELDAARAILEGTRLAYSF